MKFVLLVLLAGLFFVTHVSSTFCTVDSDCNDNGFCLENACHCFTSYQGAFCDDKEYLNPRMVFSLGQNNKGQLGISTIDAAFHDNLHHLSSTEKFDDIKSGADFTVLKTMDYNLFCVGDNANGQCGLGHTTTVTSLTQIESITSFMDYCVMDDALVVLVSPTVIKTVGKNDLKQLGRADASPYDSSFGVVPLGAAAGKTIKKIVCDATSAYIITNEDNDYLYSWGTNNLIGTSINVVKITDIVVPDSLMCEKYACLVKKKTFKNFLAWGETPFYVDDDFVVELKSSTTVVPDYAFVYANFLVNNMNDIVFTEERKEYAVAITRAGILYIFGDFDGPLNFAKWSSIMYVENDNVTQVNVGKQVSKVGVMKNSIILLEASFCGGMIEIDPMVCTEGNGQCISHQCICNEYPYPWAGENCEVNGTQWGGNLTLTEDLKTIIGKFDFTGRDNNAIDCNVLYDAGTMAILGENAICSWDEPFEYVLRLGKITDDSVTMSYLTTYVDNEVKDYPVTLPDTAVGISAVITAFDEIGQCDPLVLDGSLSVLGTHYAWSCTSGDGMAALNTFLSGKDQSIVEIPTNYMTPGTSYTFKLITSIGPYSSNPSFKTVDKSSIPLPIVGIDGGVHQMAFDSDAFVLQGLVSYVADCFFSDTSIGYSWVQTCGPALTFDGSKKYISFPGGTFLRNNSYCFKFTAYSQFNPQALTSIEVQVDVITHQLYCVVDGGYSKQIPYTSSETISVSHDTMLGVRTYSWECSIVGGGVCIDEITGLPIVIPSASSFTIASGQLSYGAYVFVATVTRDHESTECVAVREITIDGTPLVSISLDSNVLLRKNKITLTADVVYPSGTVDTDFEFIWSLEAGDVNLHEVNLTAIDRRVFVVKEFALSYNVSYIFKCTVYDPNMVLPSGSSSQVVVVNLPPLGGSCAVSPKIGTQISTNFEIVCATWNDDNLPLSYSFSYDVPGIDHEIKVLKSLSQQNYHKFFLPIAGDVGTNYTVGVKWKVVDSYGSDASGVVNIQSFPYQGSFDSVVDDLLSKGLENSLENKDDTTAVLSNAAIICAEIADPVKAEKQRYKVLKNLEKLPSQYPDVEDTPETAYMQSSVASVVVSQTTNVTLTTKVVDIVDEMVERTDKVLEKDSLDIVMEVVSKSTDNSYHNPDPVVVHKTAVKVATKLKRTTTRLTKIMIRKVSIGEKPFVIEKRRIIAAAVKQDTRWYNPFVGIRRSMYKKRRNIEYDPYASLVTTTDYVYAPVSYDTLYNYDSLATTTTVTDANTYYTEPYYDPYTITHDIYPPPPAPAPTYPTTTVTVYDTSEPITQQTQPIDTSIYSTTYEIEGEATVPMVEKPIEEQVEDPVCAIYDEKLGTYTTEGTYFDPATGSCVTTHFTAFFIFPSWNCSGVNMKSSKVCSGHGKCEHMNGICSWCHHDYSGGNCETFKTMYCWGLTNYNPDVCSGNGECLGGNVCECNEGYYGPECEQWDCDGVNKDNAGVCGGFGECTSPESCNCNTGFYGTYCSDSCDSSACSGSGGSCTINGVGDYSCGCPDGLSGDLCDTCTVYNPKDPYAAPKVGYFRNGKCYHKVKGLNLNWEKTRDYCKTSFHPASDIPVIEDDAKQQFIDHFIGRKRGWLLLSDGMGSWKWMDEVTDLSAYNNWKYRYPRSKNGHCGAIIRNGKWRNYDCSNKVVMNAIVCELKWDDKHMNYSSVAYVNVGYNVYDWSLQYCNWEVAINCPLEYQKCGNHYHYDTVNVCSGNGTCRYDTGNDENYCDCKDGYDGELCEVEKISIGGEETTYVDGYVYNFFETRKTWTDARAHCKTWNPAADLAIISNEDIQDTIVSIVGVNHAWIGALDFNEGTFLWVDQTPLESSYTNWFGYADDGGDFGEDCVEYRGYRPFSSRWVTSNCAMWKPFVCGLKVSDQYLGWSTNEWINVEYLFLNTPTAECRCHQSSGMPCPSSGCTLY